MSRSARSAARSSEDGTRSDQTAGPAPTILDEIRLLRLRPVVRKMGDGKLWNKFFVRYHLPSDPGEVYADSAYRGRRFAAAVRARAGTPRIAAVGVWARFDPASQREAERWLAERNRAIHRIRWRDLANAHLQARLTATAFSLTRTGNLLAAV